MATTMPEFPPSPASGEASHGSGADRRRAVIRRCTIPRRVAALACLLAAGAVAAADLRVDQSVSNEGYFQLSWESEEPVRLVEATSPEFTNASVLYQGGDTARVISGKPDGIWHYRLESAAAGGAIGEPITVTVRHHSLQRAFAFFALGAIVFAATLGLILFARPEADERRR
jgi:hypothetical protein